MSLLHYKTFLPHEERCKALIFVIVHWEIILDIVNHEWHECRCVLKRHLNYTYILWSSFETFFIKSEQNVNFKERASFMIKSKCEAKLTCQWVSQFSSVDFASSCLRNEVNKPYSPTQSFVWRNLTCNKNTNSIIVTKCVWDPAATVLKMAKFQNTVTIYRVYIVSHDIYITIVYTFKLILQLRFGVLMAVKVDGMVIWRWKQCVPTKWFYPLSDCRCYNQEILA
jgi:hypothetical protein